MAKVLDNNSEVYDVEDRRLTLFLVKDLDQFSMKQQYILGTVRMPMDRNHSAGKKSIEHTLTVVVR